MGFASEDSAAVRSLAYHAAVTVRLVRDIDQLELRSTPMKDAPCSLGKVAAGQRGRVGGRLWEHAVTLCVRSGGGPGPSPISMSGDPIENAQLIT